MRSQVVQERVESEVSRVFRERKTPAEIAALLPRFWVDGESASLIPVTDRGFLYGDGVFETIRVCYANLPLWAWHRRRLHESCLRLDLPVDLSALEQQLFCLVKDFDAAVVKAIVTRGDGRRGYNPSGAPGRVVVGLHPLPELPEGAMQEGVCVRCCRTRLGHCPALAGMKHMGRLEQVMARAEWQDNTHFEGLLFDVDDWLVSGTMSNVFLVKSGVLYTPDLSLSGVRGVMRQWILDNLGACEKRLGYRDLEEADEVFLTNSVVGVVPVSRCSDVCWSTGPVTRNIQERWARLIAP